jgi:predicted methyltransferase MtxX (methanogen marker protein 4)
VIEVRARETSDLPRLELALRALSGAPTRTDHGARRVSVPVSDASDELVRAVHAVQASGVEVDEIAARQPNLDEVFLALTARPHDTDRKAA